MAERVDDQSVRNAGGGGGQDHLAEIAKALREVVAELKEVNTSLRAIARSQAQQATQKRPQST
jgi:cell division protein ZapA (FtsZ GTPase activity inhibitor)